MTVPRVSGESPQGADRVPYLHDVPLDQARARFHEALRDAGALSLGPAVAAPLDQAVGRVTASAVWGTSGEELLAISLPGEDALDADHYGHELLIALGQFVGVFLAALVELGL